MSPLNLIHLSQHQRQLYGVVLFVCLAAFLLGLSIGLLRWFSSASDTQHQWKPTPAITPADTLTEFSALTSKPHWFMDAAQVAAQAKVDEQKSLEGQPEAYKLLGIIEKAGKKQALFMPIEGLKTPSARKVISLSVGDTLIGDWKVKELSASKVSLIADKQGAEPQTKDILLYATNSKLQ